MSNERRLATFAFSLLLLAYAIALFAPSHSMAQPVNFGKSRLMVTAFGADNTGVNDAGPGIRAAINSCNATYGCEVYFPAGTYKLNTPMPSTTAIIAIAPTVPIALTGAGESASTLSVANPSSDIIASHDVAERGTAHHDAKGAVVRRHAGAAVAQHHDDHALVAQSTGDDRVARLDGQHVGAAGEFRARLGEGLGVCG
jgi:hypothetical protein